MRLLCCLSDSSNACAGVGKMLEVAVADQGAVTNEITQMPSNASIPVLVSADDNKAIIE